jgi:hypothetical protein
MVKMEKNKPKNETQWQKSLQLQKPSFSCDNNA